MIFIIAGKSLAFWLGLLALASLIVQLYVGYKLTRGRPDWFKLHRYNAIVLGSIVGAHVVFNLLPYVSAFVQRFEPVPTTTTSTGAIAISIDNYAFNPATITINKGETVTWTNQDAVQHQISGGGIDGPLFGNRQTYSYTFATAGTFAYYCGVHPFMKGTVVVQ